MTRIVFPMLMMRLAGALRDRKFPHSGAKFVALVAVRLGCVALAAAGIVTALRIAFGRDALSNLYGVTAPVGTHGARLRVLEWASLRRI